MHAFFVLFIFVSYFFILLFNIFNFFVSSFYYFFNYIQTIYLHIFHNLLLCRYRNICLLILIIFIFFYLFVTLYRNTNNNIHVFFIPFYLYFNTNDTNNTNNTNNMFIFSFLFISLFFCSITLQAVLVQDWDMSLDGTVRDSPSPWTRLVMSKDIWDI